MLSETGRKKGFAAKLTLLATAAIWGSAFIVLKDAIDVLPAFFVLAFRFLTGGVVLALVFCRSFKNFSLKTVLKGSVTGVAVAAAYALQTIGLRNTTPGVNAFLTAVYCVLTPFMAWAVTRVRPSAFRFAAAVVCFAGIGLISNGSATGFTFAGEGVTLISGVFFALQIILIDRLGKDSDTMQFTVWELISCGAVMTAIYLFTELDRPLVIDGAAWWRLIYLGVVATGGALAMMSYGVKYSSPVAGSLIMSLESVFGAAFSILFGYETPTALTAAGFVLVFVAIAAGEGGQTVFDAIKKRVRRMREVRDTAAENAITGTRNEDSKQNAKAAPNAEEKS